MRFFSISASSFLHLVQISECTPPWHRVHRSYIQSRYLGALFLGIAFIIPPFIFGVFNHIHVSSWIIARLSLNVILASGLLAASPASRNLKPEVTSSLLAAASTLGAALLIGHLRTLLRICAVFRSQELETYLKGLSGLMGNVFKTANIPCLTMYAALLYGEVIFFLALLSLEASF